MSNALCATSPLLQASDQVEHPLSDAPARTRQRKAILYVDHQNLTRECVSLQLAALLPATDVVAIAGLEEISSADEMSRFSVALVHKHATPCESSDFIAQLTRLSDLAPSLPVAILSDTDDPNDIVKAFKMGIRGYIPITLPIKHAAEAIRLVGSGGSYVPSSVLSLNSIRTSAPSAPARKGNCVERFTPRQMEVLQRLWQGKQNKSIAYDLEMCESTVKVHIRHIMKKLNARNRTQVVLLTRSLNEDDGASIAS
jgi:DNA-binding NarL/FixJ family response regulator